MSQSATTEFWNRSYIDHGAQGMEKSLTKDSGWESVLQSGREELASALETVSLRSGQDRKLLEIGCGMGRVTFALAELFGDVVGTDIAEKLLDEARARNQSPRIQFKLITTGELEPGVFEEYDVVFSNEVMYYLSWPVLSRYCRDAFRILKPGGELVFQLNMERIGWITRLSWQMRKILYFLGIKRWRGWPTGPGFERNFHPEPKVRTMLEEIGFRAVQVGVGRSIRQTWYLAEKPVHSPATE